MEEGSSRSRDTRFGALCVLVALPILGGCGVLEGGPVAEFAASADFDGGTLNDAPCVETVKPVSGTAATAIGATAYELLTLVEGDHRSNLTWVEGNQTHVVLSVENPHVFSVVSRTNPYGDQPYTARHCANYARIDATVRLQTADGRLDEVIANVSLVSYGAEEVRGLFTIKGGEIHGTYKPSLRREHCFANSTFRILIARDGTHGSQTDALGTRQCQADGGLLGTAPFASGHWGARWLNY